MIENNRPSLTALIKQTARILRDGVKSASKKTHSFIKDTNLSNKNKIEQIASLLRCEAKKSKKHKKKKD